MKTSFSLRHGLIGLLALALVLTLGVPAALAQDDGPRTLTDALRREVTLEAPPQRVVGLSASIIDMLFALGVTPVGVTEGIEHPAAAGLPTFGTGYQLDLEALAALEPDLIFANAQLQAQLADQLSGIAPTIYVLTLTADDVPANVRLIGEATWKDNTAEALAKAYEDFLAFVPVAAAGHEGPSVLIIVGTLDMPNFGKSSTYLGDMVVKLGGTVVGDDQPDAGPFPGYAQLSVEAVVEADPDMILTITRGAPGTPPIPEAMATDPIWSSLSAFENGRVYELDNRLYVEAPGPRFTEALTNLFSLFYGGEN